VWGALRCSVEQGPGADRLLPTDEPSRRLRLAADVRDHHLQRQERRRTEHHRDQLRAQVGPQGQHWQPIRDPFELTSPTQHASRRVISFWNFLA